MLDAVRGERALAAFELQLLPAQYIADQFARMRLADNQQAQQSSKLANLEKSKIISGEVNTTAWTASVLRNIGCFARRPIAAVF